MLQTNFKLCYINPYTGKHFETVEEFAEAADNSAGHAQEMRDTGRAVPPRDRLKQRQEMTRRSWRVVTDLPQGYSQSDSLRNAGLNLVGNDPNNPYPWDLPDEYKLKPEGSAREMSPDRRKRLKQRGWTEKAGVWEQRRAARSRSPATVQADHENARYNQDLLFASPLAP